MVRKAPKRPIRTSLLSLCAKDPLARAFIGSGFRARLAGLAEAGEREVEMGFRTGAAVTVLTAIGLGLTSGAAVADDTEEIRDLRQQMNEMRQRLQELETEQAETKQEVKETRDNAVLSKGSEPGRFRLPGTDTEVEIGGYIKADFIFDTNESVGDLFVTESLTTGAANDEQRFRAHARQSRLRFKTFTPTDLGEVTTHLEGDFFGNGGNEVFSNSHSFRLRHATATVGGLRIGQYWTNFMPIESYPATVDFQGPAGIPFIRQAQLRYTHDLSERWTLSGSVENSEFSGRDANGAFSESTNDDFGINAGLDQAPDITAATTYSDDWGLVKLAGVGRYLGSPNDQGDDAFGWGVNLSGNAERWTDGILRGSLTYGDGVGRYILNGFGQDGFVDANGDVQTIEAYGATVQVGHNLTNDVQVLLAYGRYEAMDTFRPGDLDNTNSVHATLFWNPIDFVTFGTEVIWGNREDANGDSDDNVRLQQSVQVSF